MYFTVKCNRIILDERHLSGPKRVVSEQKWVWLDNMTGAIQEIISSPEHEALWAFNDKKGIVDSNTVTTSYVLNKVGS